MELIQVVKEKNYNFDRIFNAVDYESMEHIEHVIQQDKSVLLKFFGNEYLNFQKDDKIILLTVILFDIIYFFEYLSGEELKIYFGDLEVKAIVNKLGLEFENTYKNYDIGKYEIYINDRVILKFGSFGIDILLELIKYDFKCEFKYGIISRLIGLLKKFNNLYGEIIPIKLCSFFKNLHPLVPLLAQWGYLDTLNKEELEIFAQNVSKVLRFEHIEDSNLNISLLNTLKTRLEKLDIIKRKHNLESLKKAIWKIINKGDDYDLKLILINFLEFIQLPTFLDFLKETLGFKKEPFRKLLKGYTKQFNLEKFLNAFVLIYINFESPDDWEGFFRKYYKFLLKIFQMMPTSVKKRTRDFLLITFDPDHDWRIYDRLMSDKIIPDDNYIKNINERNYRKLI